MSGALGDHRPLPGIGTSTAPSRFPYLRSSALGNGVTHCQSKAILLASVRLDCQRINERVVYFPQTDKQRVLLAGADALRRAGKATDRLKPSPLTEIDPPYAQESDPPVATERRAVLTV